MAKYVQKMRMHASIISSLKNRNRMPDSLLELFLSQTDMLLCDNTTM